MKILHVELPDGTRLEIERFGMADSQGRYPLHIRRWEGSQYRGREASVTVTEFKAFLLEALGERVVRS
jgi:hypothetical protein